MVELWISLLRNAACVLKSLLPPDHPAMQPIVSIPFLKGLQGGIARSRAPTQQFTGLEGFIGILQLAGAGFNLLKGAKSLGGGMIMVDYIARWRKSLDEYGKGLEGTAKNEVDALKGVLAHKANANKRRIAGAICQLVIGVGLLWLALFSWKLVGITSTAAMVAILEVALAVLLVMGVRGVLKMWTLSNRVHAAGKPAASDVEMVEFLASVSSRDAAWEPDVRVPPTAATLRGHMEGMSMVAKDAAESDPGEVQAKALAAKDQAALDAFLIALNVLAFVGYGTIPLDVFFPDRSLLVHWLPPGSTAWWGNLVGDVAWTVEPLTLFLAPYLVLRRTKSKQR